MSKKVFLVALLLSLIIADTISAQSKKGSRDSTTVIIFNQSSTYSGTKHKKNGENNIIKIAPLGLVSGTFPILYEKSITDFLSLQVGVGLTGKNYWREAVAKDANPNYMYPDTWTENENDQADRIYNFDHRKIKMGYLATIQPRLYFESDGLEGGFIGFSFDYYRYNFEIPGIANNANNDLKYTGSAKSEFENIKDFMVHWGSQVLNDKITLEYSLALGLRNINGSKYVYSYNSSNAQLLEGLATYKQTAFNYNIGFKVGYHF